MFLYLLSHYSKGVRSVRFEVEFMGREQMCASDTTEVFAWHQKVACASPKNILPILQVLLNHEMSSNELLIDSGIYAM